MTIMMSNHLNNFSNSTIPPKYWRADFQHDRNLFVFNLDNLWFVTSTFTVHCEIITLEAISSFNITFLLFNRFLDELFEKRIRQGIFSTFPHWSLTGLTRSCRGYFYSWRLFRRDVSYPDNWFRLSVTALLLLFTRQWGAVPLNQCIKIISTFRE